MRALLREVYTGWVIRVHATVSLVPEHVPEALDRARAMLRADDNVVHAEIGRCFDPVTGDTIEGRYVVTTVFHDRAGLARYAAGAPHQEVHAWSLPLTIDEVVSMHEVETIK
ncbi:MAG: hypothetical protein U0W40_08580 [Acidimicrobiia bacterium]